MILLSVRCCLISLKMHDFTLFAHHVCVCVYQARAPVEPAGGEETHRWRWLAVKDHVRQHQLDSHHPSHGTCTHARPSDGKIKASFTIMCQ